MFFWQNVLNILKFSNSPGISSITVTSSRDVNPPRVASQPRTSPAGPGPSSVCVACPEAWRILAVNLLACPTSTRGHTELAAGTEAHPEALHTPSPRWRGSGHTRAHVAEHAPALPEANIRYEV